jgi:hypothetical protein
MTRIAGPFSVSRAYDGGMATPRSGKQDERAPGGDDREPGATAKRPAWQKGHLPRMPRDSSDDEADWVTGWFHERLLDGLSEQRAEDQEQQL